MVKWQQKLIEVNKTNLSMNNIIKLVEKEGNLFFEKSNMKFWNSRVCSDVYSRDNIIYYFITSEKREDQNRLYTIRSFNIKSKRIETIGSFQQYLTANHAKKAILVFINN